MQMRTFDCLLVDNFSASPEPRASSGSVRQRSQLTVLSGSAMIAIPNKGLMRDGAVIRENHAGLHLVERKRDSPR
jgi:hypothetical protein